MSTRPVQPIADHAILSRDLEALREQTLLANAAATREVASAVVTDEMATLTPTEQSAASLGVHPEAFRPISFLNTSHYQSLLKANALGGQLAQKLEAYKTVSGA